MLLCPMESPGLIFTHAKILRFLQGIPTSLHKEKGVCDFTWFLYQEALGKCHEVGTAHIFGMRWLSLKLLCSTH